MKIIVTYKISQLNTFLFNDCFSNIIYNTLLVYTEKFDYIDYEIRYGWDQYVYQVGMVQKSQIWTY